MRWPFVSRRERLRREAADWIARLNGSPDARERAAFEQWRSASPEHARAYDRLSALFHAAGKVRPEAVRGVRSGSPAPARAWPVGFAAAAAAAGLVLVAVILFAASPGRLKPNDGVQVAAFSATSGKARRVELADGSTVELSADSKLEVAFTRSERRLRLVRGEGRFKVAHERRAFIVAANGAEVVARGTQFIVRIGDGRTLVSLIEGRVDVAFPQAPGAPRRQVRQLTAGQQIVVGSGDVPSPRRGTAANGSVPERATMLRFDETALTDALALVNRSGATQVRLRDPSLGSLKVTGAFRVDDSSGFADSVAAMFGLVVEREADGGLSLRRQR